MDATSRILITGGGGFIGAHLAAAGLARGLDVHVTTRPGSDAGRVDRLAPRAIRHEVDLRDRAALRRCLRAARPHVVFHLAASPRRPLRSDLEDVADFVSEDLGGLVRLLQEASSAPHPPAAFVRSGSIAEYGEAPLPHVEERREQPVTAYGASLVAASQIVASLGSRLPFPAVTARFGLVYGPEQAADYFIPQAIAACLAGDGFMVRRSQDRRDLVFVEDVAEALLRIGHAPSLQPGIVNVASGSAPSMGEIAEVIAGIVGMDSRRLALREDGPPTGAPHLCLDVSKVRSLFGWQATTPLREGLTRTVNWTRRRTAHAIADPLQSGTPAVLHCAGA
ncbi:NAD(P)-dependent oxidoreductase [Aureimonas sp. AU12]|uniref:NAD-dependent epimerase/dehydratase family protein n=1 Tax=Aureimonas sp. AU12 TaxID=1638161 RepID=UPI0007839AE6|nr:NAD(P)-dependent oxidoreductase [Aureimonas sp. AU12]